MQIHELPTSSVSDTDKLAFDTGANTYSGTFSSIAASVLSKLTSQTFSALTTTAKTVIGAINELKTALSNTSLVTTFTNLTFSTLNTSNKTLPGAINELNNNLTVEKSSVYTASNSYCSVEYSYAQCGKIVILSVYFTPKTTVTMDTGPITLASLPGTPHNTIVSATICVTQSVSTPLGSAYLSPSKFMVAFGPRTSGQSYRATFAYMV